jgi:8-hydroxy-5-deazaflavin:NADPH oxidoreductase
MKITIIGTGNMAQGIGTRIATSNHELTILGREAAEAQDLAKKLGDNVNGEILGDIIGGEVIILALPYPAIPEVLEKYKNQLENKIIIDITNPVDFNTFQLIPPAGSSGAEEIAKKIPVGAKLVKAFNTVFAGTLGSGKIKDMPLDIFIAGEDQSVKDTVKQIVTDSGMRPIDAGPLSNARHLEGFMLIHMTAQEQLEANWMSAIKIIS